MPLSNVQKHGNSLSDCGLCATYFWSSHGNLLWIRLFHKLASLPTKNSGWRSILFVFKALKWHFHRGSRWNDGFWIGLKCGFTLHSFCFRAFNDLPLKYLELQRVDCSFHQFVDIDIIRAVTMGLPLKSTKHEEVLPVCDVCKSLNLPRMVPEKKMFGLRFPECFQDSHDVSHLNLCFPMDSRTPPTVSPGPPTP